MYVAGTSCPATSLRPSILASLGTISLASRRNVTLAISLKGHVHSWMAPPSILKRERSGGRDAVFKHKLIPSPSLSLANAAYGKVWQVNTPPTRYKTPSQTK